MELHVPPVDRDQLGVFATVGRHRPGDWPANECGLFWAITKAAKVWADLDALGVPGIQGVWSPPEAAGWGKDDASRVVEVYEGKA